MHAVAAPDDELGRCAYGIAFSPDGKILAACGSGLTLWRVVEGEQVAANASGLSFKRMAHLPGQRSLHLCISPNGKLLAWADHNTSVCLWDLAAGREIPFLEAPPSAGWVNHTFYPDSDHVTINTGRGAPETWDIRTVRWVSSVGKKGGEVAVSPDGRWLLGPDETLWSSQTGAHVFALPQESSPIWARALSPHGESLALGNADGSMEIWNVPRIQAQLAEIGLASRADARPQRQQPERQPSILPTTVPERQRAVIQRLSLGKRLAWVGRAAEAEAAYRGALELMPGDPEAHATLGQFLEDQARHTEAEAELTEAINLQPEMRGCLQEPRASARYCSRSPAIWSSRFFVSALAAGR